MDPTLKCFEFSRQHFSQYQSDKMSYQIGTWKLYWISFFLDNYFCFDLGFEPMWIRQRRENSKHSSYLEPSIGKRLFNNGKFVLVTWPHKGRNFSIPEVKLYDDGAFEATNTMKLWTGAAAATTEVQTDMKS